MNALAVVCFLGVLLLCFLVWRFGGAVVPGAGRGHRLGHAYLRKHKRAVEDAQAEAIDKAADEAAAKILGPVPTFAGAPPQTPPNG